MKSTIVAFTIALIVSGALTPLVRSIALAAGAIDDAGGRRVHAGRVPRLGGLAVATAFFVPLVVLLLLDSSLAHLLFHDPRRVLGLAAGSAIVIALGAVDDVRGVRPRNKLLVQCAAALVAWATGYGIRAVALPLLGTIDLGVFSVLATVLWFVGVINALNLIDGLDGLAAGIAFFACITNLVVGSMNDSFLVVLLSGTLCGALMGFLIYNFNPASIFMGDSGSMFLGYVLAATSLLGSTIKSSTTVAILVPVVALGVPITDTVWAFARRVKQRRSIFDADRGHIHHRLLDIGLSQRHAVMLLYGFSVTLTVVAAGLALGRSLAAGGALIVMAAMLIGVVRTARSFTLQRHHAIRQRPRLPLVEELRVGVPDILHRLHEQLDLSGARKVLEQFAAKTGLAGCSLQLPSYLSGTDQELSLTDDGTSSRRLEYVLPSVDQAAQIRFWLRDSHGDDQVHVLLQLVADAVDRALAHPAHRARARAATEAAGPVSSDSVAHGKPSAV